MSKVEVVCPFCNKPSAVEKSSHADVYGLQRVKCSHCSKGWSENLSATGALSKAAPSPSSELAALRIQVRAQMDELLTKINTLLQQREAASRRFNTNGREVQKTDGEVREMLNKALDNGTRIDVASSEVGAVPRFRTVETIGVGVRTAPGGRFVPDGAENNDAAKAELTKALASPTIVD